MTEKKRPPRFDDIAARSHRPPLKRAAVSPFALAYDAEEARKAGPERLTPADATRVDVDTNPEVDNTPRVDANSKVGTNQQLGVTAVVGTSRGVDAQMAAYEVEEARKAGLEGVTPADATRVDVDTNPQVDTNSRADTNQQLDANAVVGASHKLDTQMRSVGTNLGTNTANVDTKVPTARLTPIDPLTSAFNLAPTTRLTPKKKNPPSWRMSRLSIRIDKEKLEQLHFVAMSRGITLQDLIGGWADAFLADEGLTPTTGLTPIPNWHQTDQMTDDVVGISTSSVLQRPEELLAYYAKWTGNSIRESDWQAMRMALSYTPTAIKAGVLMSILRTKTKVNSFKYCLGAIDEVAKAGIVGSNEHLRYLEMKVEKARGGK